MSKTVMDIYKDYLDKKYENTMEYPKGTRYKDSHVFDEDKSVKWNKEEVARKNKELDDAKKAYRDESSKKFNEMVDDIIEAILNEYDVNKEQANKIYSRAYAEKHSSFSDVFYEIEELAEFYEDMRKMEE